MVVMDENYYQITGWMINNLKLKGIALKVYAIIYGFSQDGESEFTGSLQYLCDFTGGTSKPTIIKALKDLTESQYIVKRVEYINNVQFNRYKANLPLLKILNGGSKETLTGVVKNFNGGSKETLPNNKSLNKELNNKKKYEKILLEYGEILSQITNDILKDLYIEYIKMREKIKSPMTDRALQMLIKKVNKLEPNNIENQKQILENAITGNWKSVYPLKEDKTAKKQIGYGATYDLDAFERMLDAKDNPPPTAADNEDIRARAEALQRELAEK